MSLKFRKLRETATLEAGATIPRAFNYKTAFFIFIICIVGLGVLAWGAVALITMNRLSTTYAEAVPSAEHEVRAKMLCRIVSMRVHYGDSVKQGDLIGLVGSTGRSTAPHLHYEITKAGKQVAPQQYFQ